MKWLYNILAKRYESQRVKELLIANNEQVARRRALMAALNEINHQSQRHISCAEKSRAIQDVIAAAYAADRESAYKRR